MYTAALVRVLPLVALCLAAPNPTPVQDRKPTRVGSIERRENTCTAAPPKDPPLSALDNPDPEQTYEFVQLTPNQECNQNPYCEIAATEVQGNSFTWGLNGGFGGYAWIDAGFSVTQYSESGVVGNCGGDPGDIICVWWREAMTSYKVGDTCDTRGWSTIRSPNKDGVGSAYVCGKGTECKNKGYRSYFTMPAEYMPNKQGTPQPWPKEWTATNFTGLSQIGPDLSDKYPK